jgi:hypothetical protein
VFSLVYSHIWTYLLTPWSRILRDKLTSSQLVKKFPALYRNPKVNYHNYKIPPPVPIPSQINPIHAPLYHILKIYLNIILLSMTGFSKWSLSLRFPHQNCVSISPIPHMCYMPCLSHSFGKEYISLSSSLCSFLLSSMTSSLLGPNIHLSTLLSIHTWIRMFWSLSHWFQYSCVQTEET